LENLQSDHEKLKAFYRKDYEEFGPTARKIIDSVYATPETLYIWPFMKMPTLPRWFSDTGRVVLVGDGAHALPPSSGQGVNQALEDVYSLTLLLSSIAIPHMPDEVPSSQNDLLEALAFWQQMRQERIDAVFDWTLNGSNVSRLPEAERKRLIAEGKVRENQGDDMSWLYTPVSDAYWNWRVSRKCFFGGCFDHPAFTKKTVIGQLWPIRSHTGIVRSHRIEHS
jgi:2-polyprenyl-6-methoxyphenol hydroxylase-like FAD-dependent oxidoreductase